MLKRKLFITWLIGLFVLSNFVVSFGQFNSYYWSHQYGAKGQLLNGAVIASCDDESAIFYNPAGMSLNKNFGVALSLISPNYSTINTTNLFGKNTSFSDNGVGLSPGLLAARLSPFGTKNIQLGICSFTRYKSDLQYKDRIVNPTTDGQSTLFTGYLNFESGIDETWIGTGLSYSFDSTFAIGATQFITSRSERSLLDFKKEIVRTNIPLELLYGWRSKLEYGYSATGGMLTKVGMIWHPGRFKLGFTYTSPTYNLISGSADYDFDDQKIRNSANVIVESNLKTTKLKEYKTPASYGLGIEFAWSTKTKVAFSTEYFSNVAQYTLFSDSDDPFNGQANPDPSFNISVMNENNAVLNMALGVQTTVNENFSYLWGLRTDFSPKTPNNLSENLGFLANTPSIIHISTGGIITYRGNFISVGLDYGFGTKKGGLPITDITDITPQNIFSLGGNAGVNTTVHMLTLSLTYDF
jgi:hypothetical protein